MIMDTMSESSDSDSNSSSWVYIDDADTSQQHPLNTFHLDCSREPIQELTEQDLLSSSSDIESDTDGISVISESEIPIDIYSNIQCLSLSINRAPENRNLIEDEIKESCNVKDLGSSGALLVLNEQDNVNNIETNKFLKHLQLLGVGVMTIAIFVGFYNEIMMRITNGNFNEDDGIIKNEHHKFCEDGNKWEKRIIEDHLTNDENLYDKVLDKIIDITIACTFGEKPTDVKKAIKECASNEYRKRKHDEYIKMNNVMPISKKESKKKSVKKIEKNGIKTTSIKGSKNNKAKQFSKSLYGKDKYKSQYSKKRNKKINQFKFNDCSKKLKDERRKTDYIPYKDNKYKRIDKRLKLRVRKKNCRGKKMKNSNYFKQHKQNNTNGEWYINLHKARSNIRKQEQVSNWMFDRAYLRNKKRNKAYWYFKWMNVREELRLKHGYSPYSS